jgi:putative membrane protein
LVPEHERQRAGAGAPGHTRYVKEEFTMMGWYGGGMGTVGLLAMGLFWLILLGLIGWLVIRLLPAGSDQPARATGESAVEILDRRMASGELDTQEWQARRGALLAAQRDGR